MELPIILQSNIQSHVQQISINTGKQTLSVISNYCTQPSLTFFSADLPLLTLWHDNGVETSDESDEIC